MTPADQIYSLPTNTGAAKLAYAMANNLTVQISHMAIGDGNGAVVNPTAAAAALVREVHRAQLNQLYQHPENPNWLVAELVIPAEVGGWTIREIGLYDVDGDLIFVGNHAEQYKPVQSQGSDETKTVRMVILVSSVAAVTLKTDPTTVMATIKFVNDSIAAHGAAADPHKQYALRGKVTTLSESTALTGAHEGLVLASAAAGARTITLPASNAALGIVDLIVRRSDSSGNRLKVEASGADKIKFHTHLNPAGYAFLVLMGAGDWWHLRSDGNGSWWPVGRHDNTPLGRPVFETTTLFAPGGYGALSGGLLNRADWPWLWDHAQQSGMLTTEAARAGMEGGWTSGDGAATFRGPEGRGEFLRLLDDGRGTDAARAAGSWQKGSYLYMEKAANTSVDKGVFPISYGITGDLAAKERLGWDHYRNTTDYGGNQSLGVNEINVNSAGPIATAPAGFSTDASQYVVGSARPANIAYPGRIKLI